MSVAIDSRHKRLAKDACGLGGKVVVVDRKVHLPCHVFRHVELVGGVADRELVEPTVRQADSAQRCSDLEGRVFRFMAEQAALATRRRVSHVLCALRRVGDSGVAEDPLAHILHATDNVELAAGLGVLLLLVFPVLVKSKRPVQRYENKKDVLSVRRIRSVRTMANAMTTT